ncbi:flavin reductase (NADPH)-like [Homalodisca vitripennis]|nr:flavin reductase (NADPH)-like [Homalodisca vitripennis]
MKHIAVFGATGTTGLCVVKCALDKGLKVRALVRDPSKLPPEYAGRIAVVKGDVLNIEDVKTTLQGQDAAIVVLGTRNDLGPTTTMSEGLKNIMAVMESMRINILSVCLSLFLFYEMEKVPSVYREVTADHRRMFRALESSDLHWVAVNAAHITDDPPSGYTTRHGERTPGTPACPSMIWPSS